MKTLICILLSFVLLLSPCENFLKTDYIDSIFVYTTENLNAPNVTSIKSGKGYILSCDGNYINNLYQMLDKSKIVGISCEVDNLNLDEFINRFDLKIRLQEKIDSIEFIYGYSHKLSKFVTIDNEKINIQIAKVGKRIKIGYPLILDSA